MLTRLCVYCVFSSLKKQSQSKKRPINSVDVSGSENRAAKIRKLDESNASVGIMSSIDQSKAIESIPEPILTALQSLFNMFAMITLSDELTPKLFFVQGFFNMLLKCDVTYVQPVLSLIPNGLTKHLMKSMKMTNLDYQFFLR